MKFPFIALLVAEFLAIAKSEEYIPFYRSCEVYSTVFELVYIEEKDQLVPIEDLGTMSWTNETIPPSPAFDLANGTFVKARKCDCPVRHRHHPERGYVYCPLSVTHCAAPRSRSDTQLYCVNEAKGEMFVRNSMFVVSAWLLCLLIWLFCSTPGKFVFSGVMATCTPYNRYLARRLQRNDPPLAQHMMRRNLYFRRRQLENSNNVEEHQELMAEFQAVSRLAIEEQQRFTNATTQEQQQQQQGIEVVAGEDKNQVVTSLRLKYYKYESYKKQQTSPLHMLRSEDPTESTDECAICYQELEDGQRVSDLLCGHTFHVSCLKEWCARRNVCPLCKATDICEPCYDETECNED